MLWCKRGEAVEKRAGGGVLIKTRPWYGKRKLGVVLSIQVHLPTTGFVLHKFYRGCGPYDF